MEISLKVIRSFCIVLAALLLCLSALLTLQQYEQPNTPAAAPLYTVKDEGGKVAVIKQSDSSEQVLSIYTHLLPEEDVEALRAGIKVYSEEELSALLEDFGL